MTNPFTAFAFPATGATANRTLPDRLSDIHDIRDFGAIGDWNGSTGTDNLAAIMAAFNFGQVTLVVTGLNVGTNTMTFAGGALAVLPGMYPLDVTTPSAFDPTALPLVSSSTSTTVTLNGSVAGVSPGIRSHLMRRVRALYFLPPGNFYVVPRP